MKPKIAGNKTRTGMIAAVLAVAVWAAVVGSWQRARGQAAPPPPPPPPPRHGDGAGPVTRPQAVAPTTRPLSPLAPGERRVAVVFDGGHDTDRADHGRPVALIAAALKVPDAVFRETFTHVRPAGPASNGPTDAEARQNKAALLAGLSPYGVTDDRLNEVSNYYRYMRRNPGDLWQHRDATAFAVVNAQTKILRFDLVDAGAGYTTAPNARVDGLPDLAVTVKLVFGTDLATNGSIQSLAVAGATTAPVR
jgi:hypothetical protein